MVSAIVQDRLWYVVIHRTLDTKGADKVANESEERQHWGRKSMDKENKAVPISTNLLQVHVHKCLILLPWNRPIYSNRL